MNRPIPGLYEQVISEEMGENRRQEEQTKNKNNESTFAFIENMLTKDSVGGRIFFAGNCE